MAQKLLGKRIKSFNIVKILGQGSFGTVFEGIDDNTSSIVAVKVMQMDYINNTSKLKQLVQTQISVLKACHNQNVIAYIDSFQTKEFLFLITQYCDGGDIQQYIKDKTIPEGEAIIFLKQILNGFKGLHEVGAMHRDFKSANIMLHQGICKIGDLGFSKQMQQDSTADTILGTSLTMAPQVLQGIPYGFNADIWSIGVVFFHILYGGYPFMAKNDLLLLKQIKNNRPTYNRENISKNTIDFIQKCLTADPSKRITWKQIYEHPLIKQTQIRTLNSGILKSRLSIKQNHSFYQNNSLAVQSPQKTSQVTMATIEIIPDDKIRTLQKLDVLIQRADKIKDKIQTIEKFEHLYIGRRNDIMFFYEFIQPYLRSFKHIRANHQVIAFILAKKSYIELNQLHDSMKSRTPFFYGQDNFQQYCGCESYDKVTEQIYQDIKTMGSYCQKYRSQIKVTSKQISSQMKRSSKFKNSNADKLILQLANEYIRLLGQSVSQVQQHVKTNMLLVIQALQYYKGNTKPLANQFQRIISNTNLKLSQESLIRKCGLK